LAEAKSRSARANAFSSSKASGGSYDEPDYAANATGYLRYLILLSKVIAGWLLELKTKAASEDLKQPFIVIFQCGAGSGDRTRITSLEG
jgi:hypothetical protein